MELKLINMLPKDIIMNHILPFTYNTQPKYLCKDIKSYRYTYFKLIDIYNFILTNSNNVYHYDLLDYIGIDISIEERLIYDIIYFIKNDMDNNNKYYSNESNITFNKIKSIIKQHKSCLNTEQINDILISNYDNEEDINININNYFVIMRRIWGACPPTSRIKYILKWIKIGNDIPLWPPIY